MRERLRELSERADAARQVAVLEGRVSCRRDVIGLQSERNAAANHSALNARRDDGRELTKLDGAGEWSGERRGEGIKALRTALACVWVAARAEVRADRLKRDAPDAALLAANPRNGEA